MLHGRMDAIVPSSTVALADLATARREQGLQVWDLSAGRAPEPTPRALTEVGHEALDGGVTHQTPAAGTSAMRDAVVAEFAREFGMDLSRDQVMATMGVKQGLLHALLAVVGPGDRVLIEDPAFVSHAALVRTVGAEPVAVPLTPEGRPDPVALRRAAEGCRAAIVNNPHNPAGTQWRDEDTALWAELACAHDLVVLSDEVYARVAWARPHRPAAAHPDLADRTVTLMSLTKSFAMGGWRIGYAAGPPALIEAMTRLQQHTSTCPSSLAQALAAAALRDPAPPEVQDMWARWRARVERGVARLAAIPGVGCAMPEAGFYGWIQLPYNACVATVARRLLDEHGVVVVPGDAFGPSGAGRLRVTLVKDDAHVDACVRALRAVLEGDADPR